MGCRGCWQRLNVVVFSLPEPHTQSILDTCYIYVHSSRYAEVGFFLLNGHSQNKKVFIIYSFCNDVGLLTVQLGYKGLEAAKILCPLISCL